MKKRVLVLPTIVVGLGLTACSGDADGVEEGADKMDTEMTEEAEEEVAVPGATYQCPDDCENGPSYDVSGPCKKCGKDLVIL